VLLKFDFYLNLREYVEYSAYNQVRHLISV